MRWNVDLHRLRIKIPLSCIPNQNNTQDMSFNFDGLIRENRIGRMVRRGVETHDVLVCVKTSERVMHRWVKSPVALLLFSIFGFGTHHDDVIKWKHFPRNWPFVQGIHRSPVNSLHKGHMTRSFGFFFDLRLNKRLSKQSWGWWFETLSRPLWWHCIGDSGRKTLDQTIVTVTNLALFSLASFQILTHFGLGKQWLSYIGLLTGVNMSFT